jgi:hypothetical protein
MAVATGSIVHGRKVSSSNIESESSTTASTTGCPRSNALSTRISSVLATSYADLEIRDALALLDDRKTVNTAETRRRIRLDIQKDVIESNGAILQEFSHVVEVC